VLQRKIGGIPLARFPTLMSIPANDLLLATPPLARLGATLHAA